MAEDMFQGFDHTDFKDEVTDRWGEKAYVDSDRWWRSKSDDEKAEWLMDAAERGEQWRDAAARGVSPDGDEAQALAKRHADWLQSIPGTPAHAAAHGGDREAGRDYVRWIGDTYVADPRFAKNYGGEQGAAFVRDALRAYAEANL